MEILSLLVVLVACWATGNVAWLLFAGRGRAIPLVLPSALTTALATGAIVFSALTGDTASLTYQALSVATLLLFVFSDLLPRWLQGQFNQALQAGALDRAERLAAVALKLPHPMLWLEAARVRVLITLARGNVAEALETQRELLTSLIGMRRLEGIANLLAVLNRQRDWPAFLQAYGEYGGHDLLEEIPNLAEPLLMAHACQGNLLGVCESLHAIEDVQARTAQLSIRELRALGLALLGEPAALAALLERAGMGPDQALGLRHLAAVRGGDPAALGAQQAPLPAELLVQPARSPQAATACQGAVARIAEASQLPPAEPPFPTRKPRWGEVPLSSGLLAALVAVFCAVELQGSSVDTWTLVSFGACVKWTALSSEPWRLLTATLLHGGVFHLMVNGYALFVLGRLAEPVFGTSRLSGIYLIAALGGSLASVSWGLGVDPTGLQSMVSVGASGAIMGLLGALLVAVLLLRDRLPRGLRQRLLVGLTLPLALQVFMVLGIPNVDHAAHLGGLLAGGLGALLLPPRAKRPVRSWERGWVVLLCGLYVVSAALGSAFDGEAFYSRLPTRGVDVPNTLLKAEVPLVWRTSEELGEGDPQWGALFDPLLKLQVIVLQGDPGMPGSAELSSFMSDEFSQWQIVRKAVPLSGPTQLPDGWWQAELRVDVIPEQSSGLGSQLAVVGLLEESSQTLVVAVVPFKQLDLTRALLATFRGGLQPH